MTLKRETARYHTAVHTLVQRVGRPDTRIYVLYLISGKNGIPEALLPLAEYIIEHRRTRSLAWQRELARAVGLLVDFLHANAEHFRSEPSRPQVLAAFADALVGGTIDVAGSDPSGLYWEPRSISRNGAPECSDDVLRLACESLCDDCPEFVALGVSRRADRILAAF